MDSEWRRIPYPPTKRGRLWECAVCGTQRWSSTMPGPCCTCRRPERAEPRVRPEGLKQFVAEIQAGKRYHPRDERAKWEKTYGKPFPYDDI